MFEKPAEMRTHSSWDELARPKQDPSTKVPDMAKTDRSFRDLTDNQLLSAVKVLVAREREATTALVLSLAEVEARQLFLALGYPSLHSYCERELQLSRAAAFSRIRAARTLRSFPAAIEHLVNGSITLTNLNVLAPHLTADNHVALMNAARYQTKETVEAQMTALSPGAESLVTVHLRLHVETRNKLRRAQDLLRRAVPDASPSEVLDRALTMLIANLQRKKLAHVKRPRRAAKVDPVNPRYIPAWMKRAVWKRDGGRCRFIGSAGRCPVTDDLDFHHLIRVADGGRTTVKNLELRCPPHNRYEEELHANQPVPYANSS